MDISYENTCNKYKGLHENLSSLSQHFDLISHKFGHNTGMEDNTGDLKELENLWSMSDRLKNVSSTMQASISDTQIFSIPPYAIAKYNFLAENDEELSLQAGEMVYLKEYVNSDWINGEINGLTGIFPVNFVTIIVDCVVEPQESVIEEFFHFFEENEQYQVAFTFLAEIEEDLSVMDGEIVTVVRQENNDWCIVKNSFEKTGLCPCNHLCADKLPRPETYQPIYSATGSKIGDIETKEIAPTKSPELPEPPQEEQKEESVDSLIEKNLKKLEDSFGQRDYKPPPLRKKEEIKVKKTNSDNSLESKYLYAEVSREEIQSVSSSIEERTHSVQVHTEPRRPKENALSVQLPLLPQANKKPQRPAPPIPRHKEEVICTAKEDKRNRLRKINCIRKQIQDKEKQLEDQLLNELDMYQEIAVAKGMDYESLNQKMDDCQENIETLSDEIQKLQVSLTNEEILAEEEHFSPAPYEREKKKKNKDGKRRKNEERKRLILNELINTEKKYCEGITSLISIIDGVSPQDNKTITEEIFLSTLTDIAEISGKIINASKCENILEVFLKNSIKMKALYTKYCIYHRKFEEFLEKNGLISSSEDNQEFYVKSYFIMPIQRILKYPLIINELSKCTDDSDENEYILHVQNVMADVASSINESKGRKDIVDKYKCSSDYGFHRRIVKWNIHALEKKSFRVKNRLLSSIGFDTMIIDLDFQKIEKKFSYFCQSSNYFILELKNSKMHLYDSLLSQLNVSENINDFYGSGSTKDKHKLMDIYKLFLSSSWKKFISIFEGKIELFCEFLGLSFRGPKRLIQKRREKYVDLCGALVKLKKNKEFSKQKEMQSVVHEYRATYKALNIQLTNDIPKFLSVTLRMFKKIIVMYCMNRTFLYSQMTNELLHFLKSRTTHPIGIPDEIQNKYHNLVEKMISVSRILKKFKSFETIAHVSGESDKNKLAIQRKEHRRKLRSVYKPSQLFLINQVNNCKNKAEVSVNIGDFVGVLKKRDTHECTNIWLVDNGAVRGYLPSITLTKFNYCDNKIIDFIKISNRNVKKAKKYKQHSRSDESCQKLANCKLNFYDEPYYDLLSSTFGQMSHHSYEEIAPSEISTESPNDLSPIYEEINGIECGNVLLTSSRMGGARNEKLDQASKLSPTEKFYYSLFDFTPDIHKNAKEKAHLENVLPLSQGQVVRVVSFKGNDWWFVESRTGQKGYVPRSFLRVYKATLLMN